MVFHSRFHNQILKPTPNVGDHSPWGRIQHARTLIHGVTMVSTASHGGFHLTIDRLNQMPECMRSYDHWYEEDCEVCMVMFCFYDEFVSMQYIDPKEIDRDYLALVMRQSCGIEV